MPKVRDDEAALTDDIVRLAKQYGRYGYRRIRQLLVDEGWRVSVKRVYRIWRREGLKVPKKQPKRGRLWLNDGSCVRLRPERPNHVWSYDFVQDQTEDKRSFRMLTVIDEFIRPERVLDQLTETPSYLIDAIDSITPKITFLKTALEHSIPLVSSMGAGAKLDPTRLQVVDISETYNCPFAQQVRKQLKRRFQIRKGIQVVFSPEQPIWESLMLTDGKNFKKSAYGTISYLPAVFGAVCASVAIRALSVEGRE